MLLSNIRRYVREGPRRTKYFFQRLFKGYDDVDVWNANHYIAKHAYKILNEWNKRGYTGYPVGLVEGDEWYEKEESQELAIERWQEIMDKILFSLKHVAADDDWEQDHKQIQEGLDLFGKYFLNLWD